MDYISKQGLENLASYKYTGDDLSFTAALFLRKYVWNTSVKLVPLWVAPNLLTFTGFFCNFLAYLLCVVFVGDAIYVRNAGQSQSEASALVYYVMGILIFIYQTLDNVDGRQARRTGTSSPLGELVDHIVDASSLSFFLLIACTCAHTGPLICLIGVWLGFIVFHWSHWEERFVGTLIMGKFNGPTEIVLFFIVVCFVTGTFGAHAFAQTITTVDIGSNRLVDVRVNMMALAVIAVGVTITVAQNTLSLHRWFQKKQLPFTTAIIANLPFLTFFVSYAAWSVCSALRNGVDEAIFSTHPHTFILGSQCLFSYIECRIIVQRICKETCPGFYPILLLPMAAAMNCYLGLVDDVVVARTLVAIAFATTLFMMYNVQRQLTGHLGIRLLTIPYKQEEEGQSEKKKTKKQK